MALYHHQVPVGRRAPVAAFAASVALASALGCSGGPIAVGERSLALTGDGGGSDQGSAGSDQGPLDPAPDAGTPADAPPADGPEVAPPPREAPYSRVEISYDDGHPTSVLSTPPSVDQRCWIPEGVLADKPIYTGDPKMTDCQIRMSMTGQPPTSIEVSLSCRNGYVGSYDSFRCEQSISLVPPDSTTSGSFSYADGKTAALDAATCGAYITRALSICQVTGQQVDP